MASSKLAKRFLPYADQAATQTAIRYGAQESGLQSIFDQRTRDYTRDANAQQTAYRSLLGSLQAAPADLNRVYNDVGLNPGLLQSLAGTPTGARLAGQLARDQSAIQQQQLGAQAGNTYQRQHLADLYQDDVSQIQAQGQALQREKGLYQSSLLDQLISDDRARRSAANAAARKQEHDDAAALQQQQAARDNALIGQGLLPDEKGNLQPLPGGKADPNAPGNKPKRTTGPGTANKDAQLSAGKSFKTALAIAAAGIKGKPRTADQVEKVAASLAAGRPASQGKVVYEEVDVPDGRGGTKKKRQPKLEPTLLPNGQPNPRAGQQITSGSTPSVAPVDQVIANAAAEQAVRGYVSTATVRDLQKLGYSVRQFPGLITEHQASYDRRIRDNEAAGPALPR